MPRERGKLVYRVYRRLTSTLTPLIHLHLRWRKFQGLEHPTRWPERLGHPSHPRPPGPLLWFHAVSLGEGMTAIPLIKHCMKERPDMNILMTTTTVSAFNALRTQLPHGVIYQFSPLDVPDAVDSFLCYWKPKAIILMESELWPNLIMGASKNDILIALINARISASSVERWSTPIVFPLINLMLSKFSLIVPLSNREAVHFQLLQAPPLVISFSADLKCSLADYGMSETLLTTMEDMQVKLAQRSVWMASSIHKGEEKIVIHAHKMLVQSHPDLVTIIVPRHPQHGQKIALTLKEQGLKVAVRSRGDKLVPQTNIYVVDTLGELRYFYRLVPIAVVGGSFFPGLKGHNVSEAAAAGCAVLTGPHIGHFSHMVSEMQRLHPLAVLQVSGEVQLIKVLNDLLGDVKILESHRAAALHAHRVLSSGVIARVWNLVNWHVLGKTSGSN